MQNRFYSLVEESRKQAIRQVLDGAIEQSLGAPLPPAMAFRLCVLTADELLDLLVSVCNSTCAETTLQVLNGRPQPPLPA